ncbi:hypothetical protein ABIA45_007433 [Bradyrhizobium sp. USDA 336]
MALTRFELAWRDKPQEEAAHLNPAFCGELLARTINEFRKQVGGAMPLAYAFVVFPLVLHPGSPKGFATWAGENAATLSHGSRPDSAPRAREAGGPPVSCAARCDQGRSGRRNRREAAHQVGYQGFGDNGRGRCDAPSRRPAGTLAWQPVGSRRRPADIGSASLTIQIRAIATIRMTVNVGTFVSISAR